MGIEQLEGSRRSGPGPGGQAQEVTEVNRVEVKPPGRLGPGV